MHELLVSFLIISLTMFPLYSEKVKRLALKERNQYVARVYWMQKLKQILQWQPCMGGGLDFLEVLVSQISTGNTDVSPCLGFGLWAYFDIERIYIFSWRWLVVYHTAVSLYKWLIYLFVCAVPKLDAPMSCRNTSITLWVKLCMRWWLAAVYYPEPCKTTIPVLCIIKVALRVLEYNCLWDSCKLPYASRWELLGI